MSRLNAGAFEFVPGRGFSVPEPKPPQPPLPEPIERPEVTVAPPPAPTISLSIGAPKPPPPTSAPTPPPVQKKPEVKQPSVVSTKAAATPSKTFSMDKAKTDTTAIANEVQAAADKATLEDLYGNGALDPPPIIPHISILSFYSQGSS